MNVSNSMEAVLAATPDTSLYREIHPTLAKFALKTSFLRQDYGTHVSSLFIIKNLTFSGSGCALGGALMLSLFSW
jgi:hypothetical protein